MPEIILITRDKRLSALVDKSLQTENSNLRIIKSFMEIPDLLVPETNTVIIADVDDFSSLNVIRYCENGFKSKLLLLFDPSLSTENAARLISLNKPFLWKYPDPDQFLKTIRILTEFSVENPASIPEYVSADPDVNGIIPESINIIFNNIQTGISLVDKDLNILKVNQTIKNWFTGRSQIEGNKCYQIYHDYTSPCVDCPTILAFQTGEKQRKVIKVDPGKDNPKWIELNSIPVHERNGEIKLVIEERRDITEQRIIQEALKTSEQLFHKAFQISPDPISINRLKDAVYLDVNNSFIEITGFSRNEIIGNTPMELGFWVNEKDRFHVVNQLKEQGEIRNFEVQFHMKSGEIREGLLSAELFMLKDEPHVLTIINDITEQKRIQEIIRTNEHFLRAVFNSIQDGINVLDNNLTILRTNRTIREWYPQIDEFIGRKCFEVFHQRKEPCELCPVTTSLEKGTFECCVVPRFSADNKERWHELFAYPLTDENGKPIGVIEYIRDVTDRRKAEDALIDSEERYRELVENLVDGQLVIQDGKIIYANPAFREMVGYSEKELHNFSFENLLSEEYVSFAMDLYDRAMRGELVSHQYELELQHKNGNSVYAEVNTQRITYHDHPAIGVTVRNISDRYHLEKELVRHREAIVLQRMEALAVTGRLAAGVAHEINNPLQGIKGQLRLLEDEIPEEVRQSKSMELIKTGLNRIAVIVRSLLDLYRETDEQPGTCKIRTVLDNLQSLLETSLQSHGVQLEIKLSPVNIQAPLPGERLNQIFMNLILNARDSMPEGGIIKISARKLTKGIRIKVCDEGVGIPGENLQKIFSPFFTTKGTKGTGLGLAVTQSLVTAVGGKIDVESSPGKGSCFSIWFPDALSKPH